jgi:peroxiredoxin
MQKHWTLISILILALAAGWIWISAAPPGSTTGGAIPAPAENFLAPDFSLTTLDGETVSLADFRGKVVLLNFWASWCPPCRSEMPAMERVYQDYANQGFVILAVNATQQDSPDAARQFVNEKGLTFPILLDTSGTVSALYRTRSLPTSFFIGADGIIDEVVIGGPMSEALLRTRVETLLSEANR